jgi:hypothetical protein
VVRDRSYAHPRRLSVRAAEAPHHRPSGWHWAACYLAYAGVLYASYHAFWLWRSTLEGVLAAHLDDREWFPPVYLGATASAGIVIFCVAVWAEAHLRGSLPSSYYPLRSYVLRLAWRAFHVGTAVGLIYGAAVLLQEWTIQSLL